MLKFRDNQHVFETRKHSRLGKHWFRQKPTQCSDEETKARGV